MSLTLTDGGAEFAVYSENATEASLCLYDAEGEREVARIPLAADGTGWHRAEIPGVTEGARYGLRVAGPFEPWRGHRFDPSKLIVDPYASRIDRPFALHPALLEFGADTGAFVPKAIATRPIPGEPGRARVPAADTIVYELNIRGFTRLRGDIAPELRGRFAALAEAPVIAHLQALGVTTVELMPADAFVDERHLPPLGLSDAWGYNSVLFGCPDPRLAPEGFAEVRRATDALHAAGLEAILDVVLNHDGESDEFGPTLSLRGLDNALYLRLDPNAPERYINDMGCGNCVALDRPPVVDMAIAALRRWVEQGGIDGFRFDLATALGRRPQGFDPHAPLLAALADDPILSKTKLIAEPWDIGPGGYRLGQFPHGWGEWNDRFRDTARRFWRGDPRTLGELATRIAGSRDIFSGDAPPEKSVNFVVAHDGFTLADLVSYAHKHNEANGEDNRDGANENYSWNHGVEGPSDDPAILAARARDMRNLIALTLFSRGTPMLAMGAELGHSQRGNNNAYAQANEISWLDWASPKPDLTAFVGRLTRLRNAHPALKPLVWLSGSEIEGFPDVEWRDANGPMTTGAQWEAAPGDVLVAVFAAQTAGGLQRAALALNRGERALELALPAPRDGFAWRLRMYTADDTVEDAATELASVAGIESRATLLLIEEPTTSARARPADRADIDALAREAGIASDWWEVSGRHTIVSTSTKLALLAAMRIEALSQRQARDSLSRLVEERRARRLPLSATLALDAPRRLPLRSASGESARDIDFSILCEDGAQLEGRTRVGEGARMELADGRAVIEGALDLPELPIGRHRLAVGGVECLLTVAPPECFSPKAVWRRRFGVAAQLYALRRGAGDEGMGGFAALGEAAAAAGAFGAAYFGVSPLHALFGDDPDRASPYHPSDRRFLNPLLIDALAEDGAPGVDGFAHEAYVRHFAMLARKGSVDYEPVADAKLAALRDRFRAFEAARVARPSDPLFADYSRFVADGGEALRRFALFEAIAGERPGEPWRRWPAPLRGAEPAALAEVEDRLKGEFDFALYLQWLADRQLAASADKGRAGGLEIGFYRDLAVGSAPDGAESWARAGELMQGATVGAPPDPFSAAGQNWNLPPPDPLAGARDGWAGLATLAAANMRHAGMLRIDHAMGLTRLFAIPEGAKPTEGAYVSYPADDLIGQIALQSQRHRCMVIGEDLGTVPDGFREKLNRAHIYGMKVLWFERDGAEPRPPADYPVLSVACASTHDLPTLSGWWSGADIGERLALGLMSLDAAEREISARGQEKRAIVAALRRSGTLGETKVEYEAALTDALAAALHAFVADSGSGLASAQADDLAGMTIGTNLPGTDRERPNWRLRLPVDVETLFSRPRAKAILAAMARERS